MNRRASVIHLFRGRIGSNERVEVARFELVRILREHLDVADPVVTGAGLEDIRMECESGQSRVATGAAAANRQTIGVSLAGRDKKSRGGHHVIDVENAPLTIEALAICATEP